MQTPAMFKGDSVKRLLQGAAAGAVVTMIVGFNWGGWVTGGTAKTMKADAAEKAVTGALLAPCRQQFAADAQAMEKFKAMTSSWSKEQLVRETVTTINGTTPTRDLIDACAAAVTQDLNKTAAKS